MDSENICETTPGSNDQGKHEDNYASDDAIPSSMAQTLNRCSGDEQNRTNLHRISNNPECWSSNRESHQGINDDAIEQTNAYGGRTLLKDVQETLEGINVSMSQLQNADHGSDGKMTHQRPKVMPDVFDGKMPWPQYLTHFETVGDLNGWNDHQRAQYLAGEMEEFKLNIGNTLNKQSMSDPLEKVMTLKKLLTSKAQDDTYDENSLFDIEYSISTNDTWAALDQSSIDELISYVFNTRFSLAECGTVINGKVKSQGQVRDTLSRDQKLEKVYTELDQIIMWLRDQDVNAALTEAFISCIKRGKENAVVRNQTCIHLMEWYKHQILEYDDIQNFRLNFDSVKKSILLVVQDVWSAIRNACISRFSHIAHAFTSSQLDDLLTHFIQICNDVNSSWQSKDGAIMGVQCLLKVISWEKCGGDEKIIASNFDEHKASGSVPHVVTRLLPPTVFTLLGHPQLSVREHAVKAYTVYIARSDMQVSISCFTQVQDELCKGIELGQKRLPHLAVTQSGFSFIDPYKAESLLRVCVYLVQHIPAEQLASDRAFYFSTFSLYLCHPASSVRQVASILFKYMVARETSNPMTLRYILQGLCCDWLPDMELLLFEQASVQDPSTISCSVTDIAGKDAPVCRCWEWREGRLLAYELIMQFLIKNHWLYTFGPYHFNTEPIESPREEKSHKRTNSLDEEKQGINVTKPRKGAVGRFLQEESRRTRTSSMSSETKAIVIQKPETSCAGREVMPLCCRAHYLISSSSPTPVVSRAPIIKEDQPQNLSASLGASEFAKARLVTVSGHQSGKDFSYHTYNTQAGYKSKKHSRKMVANAATSLLLACKYGGENEDQEVMSPRTVDKHTYEMCHPCLLSGCTADSLEDLATLLERIFYQTVESLGDVRWELRRMGQQLLPCLVEVIRWYDMKILEDIWDNQLKSEASLLSYGACLSFKFSLAHAARLQNMLKSPPPSWQDIEACQNIILQIVDPVRLKIDVWSQIIYSMLQERTEYDKFTIVAMETLMLAQSHFDLISSQKYPQLLRVRSVIIEVFSKAHPDCSLAKELSNPNYNKVFSTPLHGYLSCCLRKENSEAGLAKQVEKCMLSDLEHSLPHFMKVADVEHTHILLPVLCAHLRYYLSDDKLSKHLTDSILRLKTCIIHSQRLGQSTDASCKDVMEQSAVKGLHQLSLILSTDTVDQHSFKQICDVYASVSQAASVHLYLPQLVSALMSKINLASSPGSACNHKKAVVLSLSNPPLAPIMNEEESSEEDEEEQQIDPSVENMTESQTLNISSHSGGKMKAGHTVASIGENSENSDWDSWDDEEDEAEDYTEAVKELFIKLQKSVDSWQVSDGGMRFRDYADKLPSRERKAVISLLEA